MKIEELDPGRVELLAELFVEMWPDTSMQTEVPFCRQILEKPDTTAFIAFGDIPLGFIYLSTRNDFVEGATLNTAVGYVEGIYVRPQVRGKGVAELLMETGVAWARQMGFAQLASDTETDNQRSEAFHKRQGFREANRVICFIREV